MSKECIKLQQDFAVVHGSKFSMDKWATGLITRLLEVTHGQWLYRNFQVHDTISGELATKKKEEIQMEIEEQQDLGEDGLLQEDQFLMEINLEDLESTSGERQEYWLLAIRAARVAAELRRNGQQQSSNEQH